MSNEVYLLSIALAFVGGFALAICLAASYVKMAWWNVNEMGKTVYHLTQQNMDMMDKLKNREPWE